MMTKPQEFAKSSFDFALFFANTTFNGMERITLLNLATARSAFETSMSNFESLLNVKDIQGFVDFQQEIAAPSIEKSVEYSRNVIAIASETKEKIAKEVETKVEETKTKVSGMVKQALQSAPAGSEVAVAAVKTAMKTASEAYDDLNKASKHAAGVAEASVAAATEASIKAAKMATSKTTSAKNKKAA